MFLHVDVEVIDNMLVCLFCRLRLNDTKSEILEKLGEATHLTSYLESELKR